MKYDGFAIITGSARGIGLAIAQQIASEGYNVVINHVSDGSAARAQAAAEEIEANYGVKAAVVKADVTKFEECKKLVQAGIDAFDQKPVILVNNAGIDDPRAFLDKTSDEVEYLITTNLVSQLHMVSATLPIMLEQKSGNIITLSSVAATQGGNHMVDYAASKGGVIAMTRAIAGLFAGDGIIANSIAPGMMATEMTASAPADVFQLYMDMIPMGTIGSMDEIKALVHYLVNTEYMTGMVLQPNGGLYI